MKKYFLITAVVVITLIVGFFVFRKEATYLKPTAGENIIVFGDSLAAGYGSNENDLATLINEKTGLPTINAGVNGDTAVSGLNRYERDVLSKNPKVVIILLGGNDFFQRIEPDQTANSIDAMILDAQKIGAGVILINENKIFATTSLFKQLAKEYQIPYIEHIMGGIIDKRELMFDQIHPNDAGYEIMAEKIRPILEDYLASE